MKNLILKTTNFILITVSVFFIVLFQADGYTDPFYLRFTSPKQNSMIIGTSRAAQGLQPQVINEICSTSIYNFSFTLRHSPFGPTYFQSIKAKLDTTGKNGIFIIGIDPWSVSSIESNPNDTNTFREKEYCLGNTKNNSSNPNFLYLFNNLGGKYYTILTNKGSNMLLHDDGWFEVSLDNNKDNFKYRLKNKINEYKQNAADYQFSKVRLKYLEKTILFLKTYGKVYLVRLPVHPKIFEIENKYMPDFDQKMTGVINISDGFLDMKDDNGRFEYTDGNHLYKSSGKQVSEIIARWILKKQQIN